MSTYARGLFDALIVRGYMVQKSRKTFNFILAHKEEHRVLMSLVVDQGQYLAEKLMSLFGIM
jgi:hypothetical protein